MKTADLVDAHAAALTFCDLAFRRFGRIGAFCGPIATVKCHEDNALLRACLEEPGAGRVMVVDGGGSTRVALLGDQIAALARDNGWAGVVINGAIRDSAEIDAMAVGVFACGVSPMKSAKDGAGRRGEAVRFGGAAFTPGGWIYCDADGVLTAAQRLS